MARHHEILDPRASAAEQEAAIAADPGFYRRWDAIVGHYSLAHPIVRLCPRPRLVVAVLREPVARVVSFFEFVRQRAAHRFHAALRDRTLFEAFTEVPEFARFCCNGQLVQVFDTRSAEAARQRAAGGGFLVGRFDRLPELVGALAEALDLPPPPPLPHRNPRRPHPALTPAAGQPRHAEALALIAAACAEERAFWEAMPPVLR
jgi:hypothetical protein